jgi:hypothetical protein
MITPADSYHMLQNIASSSNDIRFLLGVTLLLSFQVPESAIFFIEDGRKVAAA